MFWVMTQRSLEGAYSFRVTDNLNGSFEAFTFVLFRVPVLQDVTLRHLANGSRHFQ